MSDFLNTNQEQQTRLSHTFAILYLSFFFFSEILQDTVCEENICVTVCEENIFLYLQIAVRAESRKCLLLKWTNSS